ncbi:MAG TPA: type IX secretion system protein PorQ [Bacteroidota bacterium]|nr:type IX secretion system protein PorQ [Bacteroidota bacterium]
MKQLVGWILTCGLVVTSCFAQDRGTFSFLRNEVGARAAALNGSFASMTNDPNLIFYNPGALSTLTQPRGSVGFLKHLLDVNGGSISYARPVEGIGTVGGGIFYLDYGSFNQTDESMNNLGSFGAHDLEFVAGISRSVDEVTSVGMNLKFIYSSIGEYRSSGIAIDAGALYRIPSQNITIGASVLTLGTQLQTYDGVKESLPLDVTIGITKRPEHLPVFLNLDFHHLTDKQTKALDHLSSFSIGAEFLMSESVRLRVGYNNQQRKDLKLGGGTPGLAGMSLGGGILIGEYVIDYAFNSYGKIGSLHRISLGMGL